MPPKKKGKGKKGKKSAKGSAKGSKSGAKPTSAGQELNELSKEFFLIQVRDLENRLGRYQTKCDELDISNDEFKSQYEQMSEDKKEIVSFLKKTLEQRNDEIADLNDRLVGLQQAKDQEKDTYEQQLATLRTEFQETKDQLTSENMILGGKLASLEEFKVQKEDLMAKFAQMEDNLQHQKEDHEEQMYQLERKAVVDKDRLKKEMVMKVNQVAAEFRKVSNKQMAETTKRTIRENVSINAQLSKMSDKTLDLIAENDELRAKEKDQRQRIEMLEATEKELAKKNHSNQKIIRMLTEKAKQTEAILAEMEVREQEVQDIDAEISLLRSQNEAMSQELQKISAEIEQKCEEVSQLQEKLEEERKARGKLEQLIQHAAHSLHSTLSGPSPDDPKWEELSALREKRDGMLEQLLILLNSAAVLGLGPSTGAFGKTTTEAWKTKSTGFLPAMGMGLTKGSITLGPVSGATDSVAHYRLGDLGLVPRQKDTISLVGQKVGGLSRTTRLAPISRSSMRPKSVGVQTVSSPKAMFFADQLLKSGKPADKATMGSALTSKS
ncbi:CFAP157 [Branchiostoma lanceolatum]|uniref:Cilia- and flagella-associated protein 157 n=1 Tax=Branchiostoma lanceolatum TaxID=7740 RepID=A0A8K0AA77_BRALA|nr:CFAP157 [Branchiostoma lanceolatum]